MKPYLWLGPQLQLGLRATTWRGWTMVGPNHAETMRLKRNRLANSPEFFYRSLPESLDAQHELRDRLVSHLAADHAEHYQIRGEMIHCATQDADFDLRDPTREPLDQLSRIIEEDFMLLQSVAGKLLISAAANAYSSSGRLVKSVGKDVPWAHIPVPGLNDRLETRIDRILTNIHADFPCERFNWQITPIGDLFFPLNPHAESPAAADRVLRILESRPEQCGDLLWIRVERQTLVRLPQTSAVAFGIHTFSDPLSSIRADRGCLQAIRNLIVGFSAERLRYLEMDRLERHILSWLDSALAAGTP